MTNNRGLTPEFTHRILEQAIKNDYKITPVFANGKTKRYAEGETYHSENDYKDAVAMALILGLDLILLDYDANKAAADADKLKLLRDEGDQDGIDAMLASGRTGEIISVTELAQKLGLDVMPPVFQKNEECNSLHYLFRIPAGINIAELKQSNDGRFLPYIDIKRGNQLCHLKPHKQLPFGLPPLHTLLEAPTALIEALKVINYVTNRSTHPLAWGGSARDVSEAREMLSFIDPNKGYDCWLKVLMAIYSKFGHSEEGVALADEWSRRGDTYIGVNEIEYKFSTLDPFGPVTFATLVHLAKEGRADINEINKMFNNDGALKATAVEVSAKIDELDRDTSPDVITALLNNVGGMQHIEAAIALKQIKDATGIPLGALKEQVKELQSEGKAENDDSPVDDLTLSQRLIQRVGEENVLSHKNSLYIWAGGVWQQQNPVGLNQHIQQFLSNTDVSVNSYRVRSVSQLLEAEVYIEGHKFNQGPQDTVNLLNGEMHIVEGRLTLRSHERAHYNSIQIPHIFDPSATAPRFIAFLKEVFSGDADCQDKSTAVLEAFGYTLMNHCRYEKFFICVGNGSNGKSVLLNVLRHVLSAENHCSIQPSKFGKSFSVAQLDGHLANIVSELPAKSVLPDDMVKIMASGEGVQVEHKNKDPFTLESIATTWVAANALPHSADVSDALFRRAVVLEFNNMFSPSDASHDINLIDKLKAEAHGIIRLALEAYAKVTVRGFFTTPASSEVALYAWRETIDQVCEFISSECEQDAGGRLGLAVLFSTYKLWHIQEKPSVHALSRREFSKRVKANGFKPDRDKHGVFFYGLMLKVKETSTFDAKSGRGIGVLALHAETHTGQFH
jgi:P4 family phage/plasmid primase-like protien